MWELKPEYRHYKDDKPSEAGTSQIDDDMVDL